MWILVNINRCEWCLFSCSHNTKSEVVPLFFLFEYTSSRFFHSNCHIIHIFTQCVQQPCLHFKAEVWKFYHIWTIGWLFLQPKNRLTGACPFCLGATLGSQSITHVQTYSCSGYKLFRPSTRPVVDGLSPKCMSAILGLLNMCPLQI